MAQLESVQSLTDRLAYEQKLVHVIDRIHAAKTLDVIFLQIKDEILELLDADRLTLYVVDPEKRELYSRFLALDAVREIRLPISDRSIAGYAALTRKLVDVADAYDAAELTRIAAALHFDASWDKKTGYRTRQVLTMPILHELRVVGVIQLLNKKQGPRFTRDDEAGVARIAKTLGIAFHN